MKRCVIIAALACASVMAFSCERKEASQEQPDIFDPKFDPHASILEASADPDLLEDQTAISRRIERTRPTPTPRPPDIEAPAAKADETPEQPSEPRGIVTPPPVPPAEPAATTTTTTTTAADRPARSGVSGTVRRITQPLRRKSED